MTTDTSTPDLTLPRTRADYEAMAAKHGFTLSKHADAVIKALERSKEGHGFYQCPCKPSDVGQHNACNPCDECRTTGHCHCGLFEVTPAFTAKQMDTALLVDPTPAEYMDGFPV